MKGFAWIVLGWIVWSACGSQASGDSAAHTSPTIFHDPTLRAIYELQDRRQTPQLLAFFSHAEANYRRQAALALASVQDTAARWPLVALLNDTEPTVQMAAAFALGQVGDSAVEESLIDFYNRSTSASAKATALEALGRCGGARSIDFLCRLAVNDTVLALGQAWAFTRLAHRHRSTAATDAVVQAALELGGRPEELQRVFSQYFARKGQLSAESLQWLKSFYPNAAHASVRANLMGALARHWQPDVSELVDRALGSNETEVVINLLNNLSTEAYLYHQAAVHSLLGHADVNRAVAASEAVLRLAQPKKSRFYLSLASADKNWRVAANLLQASLRAMPENQQTSEAIIALYQQSEHIYEKAFLLRAMGESLINYKFVAKEAFTTQNPVLASYGMEALVNMRALPSFDYQNDLLVERGGQDLYREFALLFKQAIASDDIALIAQAAIALRDTAYNYANAYDNAYFLTQALHRLELPEQVEAYIELQKTIAFFQGEPVPAAHPAPFNNPIDWDLVQKIGQNQLVKVQTNKGDIQLRLKVDEAPGTVANFVRLARQGYFRNKHTHRVVPNFVVQAGCPRGDGWGSPNYSIRSEFSFLKYGAGAVGMASAGKDTESSQWFITHSPTPHLDGRYTIFAEVASGMEVVHRLEVGDQILSVEL